MLLLLTAKYAQCAVRQTAIAEAYRGLLFGAAQAGVSEFSGWLRDVLIETEDPSLSPVHARR